MNLVVIVVARERQDDVIAVLDRAGVSGYSIIPHVLGRGVTGPHLGTRAFPGDNSMVVALVGAVELDAARTGLRALQSTMLPGQGLSAFGFPAEPLLRDGTVEPAP